MDIEREGSGLLFDNSEYKEKNPNAPDFTGNVNVNGEQLRIAAWYKDFASGEGFSLSLTPIDGNYSGGGKEAEEEDEEPAPAPAPTRRSSAPAKPASRGTSKSTSGRTYAKPSRR